MNANELASMAQLIKVGLTLFVFSLALILIVRKLSRTLKKGTSETPGFNSVNQLISLGLTVMLLSTRVNNLFSSILRFFVYCIEYVGYVIQTGTEGNPFRSDLAFDITSFRFSDLIIVFAVWIFIYTLLNVLFQSKPSGKDSPRIFSDRLFAKNTFIVFLLVFSIYLCIASIIAIPEFQALENAEVNNEELTEFTREIQEEKGNNKEDLMIRELPVSGLRLKKSSDVYTKFNSGVANYNQIINLLWKDHEQRKINVIDAYKGAIQEKTATRERIRYRSQLKTWLQEHSATFTLFVYYKPGFESTLREVVNGVSRIDQDSTLRANSKVTDSLYREIYDLQEDWDRNMETIENLMVNVKNVQNSIPEKPKIGEQYGVFQSMSGWLLSTESMSLALIVGLFAFGLLGSIGSTFIRRHIQADSRYGVGDFIPNLPAVLVNGISSAIVVFLAVKGTLVVFSGKDNGVNPYALFFTCLVAAVFSEDVWKWARTKLNQQLKGQEEEAIKVAQKKKTTTKTD